MKARKHTYDLQRIHLKDAVPLDTPFQLCLEPTFLCNLRCNYCMHAASREELEKQGFRFKSMEWDTFERIVQQMKEFPHKIKKCTFSGFGEPLLDKRLPEMIRVIRQSNAVEKILVISNGLLLTPELGEELIEAGLSELKISIQGMTAQKYKEVCGAEMDYEKFYHNLITFYQNRKDCILRIKIADTALDPDEEKMFYQRYGDICDYIAIEHIYEQFSFVDYDGKLQSADNRNRFGYDMKKVNICSALFFKLNILQEGRITFGFPDGVHCEGFNVNKMTLLEAWNSQERLQLLYDHLNGDYSRRPECMACTRWSYSVVPEDLLDGYEEKILARMPALKESMGSLQKCNIPCANIGI